MTALIAVAILLGTLLALVLLGIDTFGECNTWTPPVEDVPGFTVLPRRPYDFEAENPC